MKVFATILLLLIIIVVLANYVNAAEHFTPTYLGCSYPQYCSSCADLSRNKCNNCVNCGYCISPRGKGECVPGDEKGPLFREDCIYYEYNNPTVMCNDPQYFYDYLYFSRPDLFAYIPIIYKEYWKTDCPLLPSQGIPPPVRPKPPHIIHHDDFA